MKILPSFKILLFSNKTKANFAHNSVNLFPIVVTSIMYTLSLVAICIKANSVCFVPNNDNNYFFILQHKFF